MRIKYAQGLKIYFWTWGLPMGYLSVYYDGWNNQLNLGFICFNWLTPPLEGDI